MTGEMIEASDGSLVVSVGRYQQEALAELYRRHAGPVLRLARRLLNDDRMAEDVLQEVFLALWHEPDRFDSRRATLRSFLLMKAHGRAVDIIRSESSRRAREDREHASPAGTYDLEREVWDIAVADRIETAMGALPETERRAISLAYFGGHTYREVALLLDEPEGTVKSRIRSGLKTLRRSLGDLVADTGSAIGGAW